MNNSALMRFTGNIEPIDYNVSSWIRGMYLRESEDIISIISEFNLSWQTITILSKSNYNKREQDASDLFQTQIINSDLSAWRSIERNIDITNFKTVFLSLVSLGDALYEIEFWDVVKKEAAFYLVDILEIRENELSIKSINEFCEGEEQSVIKYENITSIHFGGSYQYGYSIAYFRKIYKNNSSALFSKNVLVAFYQNDRSNIITYDYFGFQFAQSSEFVGFYSFDNFTIEGIRFVSLAHHSLTQPSKADVFRSTLLLSCSTEWYDYTKDLNSSNYNDLLVSVLNNYGGLIGIDYIRGDKQNFMLADLIEINNHSVVVTSIGQFGGDIETIEIRYKDIVALTLGDSYTNAYLDYLVEWEASNQGQPP